MPHDPALTARIRALVPPGTTEKRLFGGHAFLRGGHLATSAYKDGGLMIRCGEADWAAFTAEPGARPMLRKDKPVSGWVLIAADAVQHEASLARWVARGVAHAEAQPPK
jgi:hypothetical protein